MKEKVVAAGCPLNNWKVGRRHSGYSVSDVNKIDLTSIDKNTVCGRFSKEIDEIGDYECAKHQKLVYAGVPSGFIFLMNSSEKKEVELEKAVKGYGDEYEVWVSDKAYYLPNIYDGVQELKGNVAVFLKRRY